MVENNGCVPLAWTCGVRTHWKRRGYRTATNGDELGRKPILRYPLRATCL